MAIIKLSNISFSYSEKSSSDGFSLNDLDFNIIKGDYISILGPNGSGKSTLLKIVANILKPSSGSRKLIGRDYSAIERNEFAKYVAFVPQNSGTNFPYSVYEIVMMGRSPYLNFLGIEREVDRKLVLDTLDLLEIRHLQNQGINGISGGEAQRALIARAIVQKPKLLLLDEPNTHLDIKHQLSISNLLKELNKKSDLTIVAISHDINLSKHYSNRVILMKDGEILFDSIPEEILTEANIKNVFDVNARIILDKNTDSSYISLNSIN